MAAPGSLSACISRLAVVQHAAANARAAGRTTVVISLELVEKWAPIVSWWLKRMEGLYTLESRPIRPPKEGGQEWEG